jgi:succinyl-CoA synthetase alpha subunit
MGFRMHGRLSPGARILRPSVISEKLRVWSKFVVCEGGVGVVSRCGGGSKKILENTDFWETETLILVITLIR